MGGYQPRQLSLPVQLRDEATVDNFLASQANQLLLDALQHQLTVDGEPVIYLYGPTGSGKSHLLQASCHLSQARALYLPLAELCGFSPADVLQDVESLGRVCLDDIHAVLGDSAWELAIFNLYNRARQQGCKLLVAGDAAPRALAVELADLRSRLGWGPVYQLARADDHGKAEILRFRASRRGLSLSPEVVAYIVARAPRNLDGLLAQLDALDKASLVEQRALSIPFVKQILGW